MDYRYTLLVLLMSIQFKWSFIVCQDLVDDEVGYFWHVTDMHVDPTYQMDSPAGSCGTASVNHTWGPFGDYLCDSPWILINSSVYAMRHIKEDVDFLIWTGDDTPHIYNGTLLDKEAVFTIISNLTDLLEEVFPDKIIYSALGNHDWSPKSHLPPGRDPFYQQIANRWSNWLTDQQAKTSFSEGGFYTLPVTGTDFDAVVLNTNLYYTSNKEVNGTGDPAGQFQWLEELLEEKSSSHRKVILIMHVPPGTFEKHMTKGWYYGDYNKEFRRILQTYGSTIGSVYAAHHHTDSFKLIYNENGEPVSSVLIAPAVTPWETTLPDVIGGAANNPAIRLVKYNKTSGVTLDIEQYYLNLTDANLKGYPEWIKEYTGTEYFGQMDMGTVSLDTIAQQFRTNDELFQRYYKINGVNYDPNEVCENVCKQVQYCSITRVDYDEYETCMNQSPSGSPPLYTNMVLVPFVLHLLSISFN